MLQQKAYPDPLASDRLEGSMNRRDRKATFILGITATTGAKPFPILGLVKKPDGSFTEAAIVPNGEEQEWGGFNHTPGETTEISFYALDDPPPLNSACREHRKYNVTRLSGETWSLGASGGFSFLGVSIPLLNDVRPPPVH